MLKALFEIVDSIGSLFHLAASTEKRLSEGSLVGQSPMDLQAQKMHARIVNICWIIGIVFLLFIGGTTWTWHQSTQPKIINRKVSSDGKWIAILEAQRNKQYPLSLSTDVNLIVTDRKGKRLFSKTIDTMDTWRDAKTCYRDLKFTDTAILAGPEYYDGQQFTYFTLELVDLEKGSPSHN
ncbi:MAG: hypothetical protein QM627_07580 [Luteolibacter sp.]